MSVSFLGSQIAQSGTLTSTRLNVTSNGSAHTKGTYTQLIASTTYPASWVLVMISRTVGTDVLVDIAVGAASSEHVVIANIPYSTNTSTSPTMGIFLFPLFIPAGSRVAARSQDASAGGNTIDVQATLFAPMFGGERGLGAVETCGANTGTSLGKTIPGHTTTANTKGTWTELIASTSFAYRWVCLGITHANAVAASSWWTIDIGVGGSGAEVVVVPDIMQHATNTSDALACAGTSFPLSIPAGTRLSARCQCSVTTASERDIELVLLGVG